CGCVWAEPIEAAELSHEVATRLRQVVPYDGWCLSGMDPETRLRVFQIGGRGTEHSPEMARNEELMDDANKFAELALADVPVGVLSPEHPRAGTSFRLNEILLPQGFASE